MFVIILIVMILLLVIFSRRPGRSERRERIYLVYVEEAETPPAVKCSKGSNAAFMPVSRHVYKFEIRG